MFAHLHVHSEYSVLEAATRVKQLVALAAKHQMPAIALTDMGNMYGAVEFYFAALDKKIKPIIGLEVFFTANRLEKPRDEGKYIPRLVLIAKNNQGYKNLCRLSSLGFQEGFYWRPRVDWELLEKYKDGIIALTGGRQGLIASTLRNQGEDVAAAHIARLKSIYNENLYLELVRTGHSECKKLCDFLLSESKKQNIKPVAANEVCYSNPEDRIVQEVLFCIGNNKTLQEVQAQRDQDEQLYFKSSEQMAALFADVPEAITNTLEIANSVEVKFKTKDENGKPIYHLPSFPTEEGRSVKEEIEARSKQGLEERFEEAERRNEEISDEVKKQYYDRLQFELGVVDRMGFNGYLLIVQDFINWAKKQDIPVGPGRGSAAGSLVAFALRITDLDPLPYSLLFERFLNPERISMPDIDVDFCQDRRSQVIDYVTEKYGAGSVSQIITYGKLQTRAAIKDVGRVLGMTFADVDAVTKLIPDKLNITLKEALEMEPRINELMETDPRVSTLIELAMKVEGLVRQSGIHAAGVIIGNGELVEHAPLAKGTEGETLVQYDMKHAEKIGLIKFDFLGLKTLTVIQQALDMIKQNKGLKISTQDISLSDPGIYDIMSQGDTAGIFQFEGDGITDATRKIHPRSFQDITAINALYRPGPMAMIPEFAKRKSGEAPVEYIFPELKTVLEETYGIIVYQEQVMAIASLIAGYSLGEADMLRRAMGKKIKEEMDQHRVRFLKGAQEKGFEEKKSEELFDLMYKFADYGFNKSHAAAYCVIAAQTAWLKRYHPAEFIAALMTSEMSDTDKIVRYSKDAQKHGLPLRPPSINKSRYVFTVKGEEIYFGLGAIKGVGEAAIDSILEGRGDDEFTSLDDFFEKIDSRKVNKKVMEALIKSGAMDEFGIHRAQLMANYPKLLERAEKKRAERESGQFSLFDMGGNNVNTPTVQLETVSPWARAESLKFEKEVLGFYLSDHPLKGLESLLVKMATCQLGDLVQVDQAHKSAQPQPLPRETPGPRAANYRDRDQGKKRIQVVGMVVGLREMITKKGTRMAFGQLEDLSGVAELVVFPDTFTKLGDKLKVEGPLTIGGLLEVPEGGNPKIIVDAAEPLFDLMAQYKRVRMDLSGLSEQQIPNLYHAIKQWPGSSVVELLLHIKELGAKVKIEPEEPLTLSLNPQFLDSVRNEVGRTDFISLF